MPFTSQLSYNWNWDGDFLTGAWIRLRGGSIAHTAVCGRKALTNNCTWYFGQKKSGKLQILWHATFPGQNTTCAAIFWCMQRTTRSAIIWPHNCYVESEDCCASTLYLPDFECPIWNRQNWYLCVVSWESTCNQPALLAFLSIFFSVWESDQNIIRRKECSMRCPQ